MCDTSVGFSVSLWPSEIQLGYYRDVHEFVLCDNEIVFWLYKYIHHVYSI